MNSDMRTETDLLRAILKWQAVLAIGPSVARGRSKGTVKVLRDALGSVPVDEFAVPSAAAFDRALDRHTAMIMERLLGSASSWGLARKSLNLYLRDCYYNAFISRHFGLEPGGEFYEVPLDSVVAKGLRQHCGAADLPTWSGLKRLTPDESAVYQRAAQDLSRKWGIARVHLDTFLWVEGR